MYSKKCILLVCWLLSLSTCLNFKCNWIWYAAWNCELLSVSPEYQGINVGNEIFSIWISTIAWFIGLLLCEHHQDESGNLQLKSRTNTQLFSQKNQELNHLNTLLHFLISVRNGSFWRRFIVSNLKAFLLVVILR